MEEDTAYPIPTPTPSTPNFQIVVGKILEDFMAVPC